jgi:GTPase SAR1 family protein
MIDFPLEIKIEFVHEALDNITNPFYSRPYFQVKEKDLLLHIKNVASYRVTNGNQVLIYVHKNVDMDTVNLYLNGSVLGAVLHQRGYLPFHGSTFDYQGKVVMICGHSGVGKSSITMAFCRSKASFICDDITPVLITQDNASIIPVRNRIKLWDDSLQRLDIDFRRLDKIRPVLSKYYLPIQQQHPENRELDQIIILNIHTKDYIEKKELVGLSKFNMLRKQIYRSMFLNGMPETKRMYFKQLVQLAGRVQVTRVTRPMKCDIYEVMQFIEKEVLQ